MKIEKYLEEDEERITADTPEKKALYEKYKKERDAMNAEHFKKLDALRENFIKELKALHTKNIHVPPGARSRGGWGGSII